MSAIKDADYPDDGHIYVCVRVRDVPSNISACAVAAAAATTPSDSRPSTATKTLVRDAQKICVSTIENIVVMHDPKSLDDSATVAKDTHNVVQVLTDRADGRSSTRVVPRRSRSSRKFPGRGLTATATAGYYEYDRCLASMDEATMLTMPIIRSSDFLQPPPYSSQEDVYRTTAMHAVRTAVEGINSCVFAYGQTGSGKTYTLFGDTSNMRRDPGVVPRAISDLFSQLEAIKASYASSETTDYSYKVTLSFFEIYQNEVYCLLSRNGPLHVQFNRDASGKKETMVIQDLQQHAVTSAEKAYPLIEMGLRRRQTSETGMNARSSRSHAIIHARVAQWCTNRDTHETVELGATINLVDLAGSERQRTSNTQGKNREEGIQINQSLATLARVINDIARGAKYVNYRDSLLTMVLKDNLGGNSRTFMIATISPVAFNYQESCATLLYARDVRTIRNRPTVNKTFQTRSNLLEQNIRLKQENEKLKDQMEAWVKQLQNTDGDGNASAATVADFKAFCDGDITPTGGLVKNITNGAAASLSPPTTEAFLAATSAGLTAPLLVCSQRRYTNLAGLGGTCVEGGVVRVAALVKECMRFPVQNNGERRSGREVGTTAAAGGEDEGGLVIERATRRSCEQRFWVHFEPPRDTAAVSRVVDVQMNGRGLGTGRRELHHGDVVCVYMEGHKGCQEQSLLTFHYVDLNCLSRAANTGPNSTTLAQLAVSVDIPADMEGLTLESIRQLQRDNAKLLDMVRQQNEAAQFQSSQYSGESSPWMRSPNARSLNDGLSPAPVPPIYGYNQLPNCDSTNGPIQRLSQSPFIREPVGMLPCDAEAAVLLERAERSVSERLDGAMLENKELHRAMAGRNTTLGELARRLAELEASDDGSNGGAQQQQQRQHTSVSVSLSAAYEYETDEDEGEQVRGIAEPMTITARQWGDRGSLPVHVQRGGAANSSAVSASSSSNYSQSGEAAIDATADAFKAGDGRMRIFFENSDGDRERYQAAVRERAQCEHIADLEAIIADLRAQLALAESRLRVAQDDSLEAQMAREELEAELNALLQEADALRSENSELLRGNTSLETLLQESEEALRVATQLSEEELARRLAPMSAQIKALRELARMWKRRTMRYIAMGYGAQELARLNSDGAGLHDGTLVPWEILATGSTAALAKKRLGCERKGAPAAEEVDYFEHATALDALVALESALRELEAENKRLLDEVRRCEAALQQCKDLIERLRRERAELEKDAVNASANEEESERLRLLLEEKCKQLLEAEGDLAGLQMRLQDALQQSDDHSRRTAASNDLLLVTQRETIDDLERRIDQLQTHLAGKEAEVRGLLQNMGGRAVANLDGDVKDYQLRNRIEDLIAEQLCNQPSSLATAGYSAFPSDFHFSDELVALLRVCLRVLLDKLKVELYVLNKQNMHKYGLMVPSVQLRPEAQFHSFMHELRGVVVEISGKAQRIGGRWSVSEADVMSDLLDHRRRRAGSALTGLLIWYDHWDLSPKLEHVSYVELIRNTERIMQMARLVRLESNTNTNATSTLLLPIPGRCGASDHSFLPQEALSNDSSAIKESRRALMKFNTDSKTGNLAKLCACPSRTSTFTVITAGPEDDALGADNRLRRTVSALAMSQTTPYARASTAQVLPVNRTSSIMPPGPPSAGTAGGQPRLSDATTLTTATTAIVPAAPSLIMTRTNTACVLAASEADIAYVANTDIARVESINRHNFSRRMSAMTLPTTVEGASPPASQQRRVSGILRRPSLVFSRCQTAVANLGAADTASVSRRPRIPGGPTATYAAGTAPTTTTPRTPQKSSTLARRPEVSRVAFGRSQTEALVPRAKSATSTRTPQQRSRTPRGGAVSAEKPKSFYNPDVLQALRERSSTDANASDRQKANAVRVEVVPKAALRARRAVTGGGSGVGPHPFHATRSGAKLGSARLTTSAPDHPQGASQRGGEASGQIQKENK